MQVHITYSVQKDYYEFEDGDTEALICLIRAHKMLIKWAYNIFIWPSVENEISSSISILTLSQIFIICFEKSFDFEFKKTALCQVTPPNSAAAHLVIAEKWNLFLLIQYSWTCKQNKIVVQL